MRYQIFLAHYEENVTWYNLNIFKKNMTLNYSFSHIVGILWDNDLNNFFFNLVLSIFFLSGINGKIIFIKFPKTNIFILVSSTSEGGSIPWYSEPCSATIATTYSSGKIIQKDKGSNFRDG